MRKRFISLSVSLLLLAMLALPAQAASANLSDSEALLPVDIIIDQDSREIRKVYDLSPNTDPAMLPMEAFEHDGSRCECTDILREVVIGSETQTITQTEPVTEEEPPQTGAGWPVMTALGLTALAAGVGGTYFVMKRKERMSYEETADNRRGGADAHHDDGHGGRV